MGKYMRKGKDVGKMEVSQGTLVGVRTRARALAMEKEKVVGNIPLLHHKFTTSASAASSCKASGSSSHAPSTQPLYMELRSRKLEKGIRSKKDKCIEEAFDASDLCKKTSNNRQYLPISSELCTFGEDRCGLWFQNDRGSLQGSDSASQNRLAHGNPRFCKPIAATISSNHSMGHSAVPITPKRHLGIITRNRREELGCTCANMDLDISLASQNSADSRNKREREVELCFGETPMVAEALKNKREYQPLCTRRTREYTPDSFLGDAEAPGSTSKTGPSSQARPLIRPDSFSCREAPNFNEIEAFLSSAEQQERRRFINRFNFDPLLERPLRGRYEWFNT